VSGDGATADPGISRAVAAMPGLCGHPISGEDIDLLRAVVFGEGPTCAAVCVAVISHAGHRHYVAAALRSGDEGWVIEQAAHTSGDQGVPRVAPAVFVGSDSRFSLAGWAPSARATRLVLEIGPYRSSPSPIDTGIVIAQFDPPVEALGSSWRILYFDDTGEITQRQSFSSTGGFVRTELSAQRDR
jgi:hypothetical protein